ncbi:MAG: hypothetical protein JW797_13570 [Bradymonadales bacterium]|nr:hypothetical protein [Bradymonadales bacterium]
MTLNVVVLLLCLVAVLLFKRVVSDRTAEFMQGFAPEGTQPPAPTSVAPIPAVGSGEPLPASLDLEGSGQPLLLEWEGSGHRD